MIQAENKIIVDAKFGEAGYQIENEVNEPEIAKRYDHIFPSHW